MIERKKRPQHWLLSASLAGVLCVAQIAPVWAADQQRPAVVSLDIQPQPLGTALNAFAQQSGLRVIFFSEISRGITAPRLTGTFSPEAALKKLLANTTLNFEFVDERTVAILSASSPVGEAETADPETSSEDGRVLLQEVVVTAQKRKERLMDVPQSVSVLSNEYMARTGAMQFRDFASSVPGLTFATAGAGWTQISLRGVTTGLDISPTTAIYVDEVPYGSSSAFTGAGLSTLDAALFDLDRIEVLRGPQGTLYGASSMGGLIKYVSREPDSSDFDVEMRTGVAAVGDGGLSYNVAAVVNAPLVADKLALRASAFHSHDGGFIDNVSLGREDVDAHRQAQYSSQRFRPEHRSGRGGDGGFHSGGRAPGWLARTKPSVA
jgi:outer membrane receptor protein involved in Fe transport